MKRPLAHVTEDESEKIFSSLLPPEWIVRRLPKDYGVDYEIEIVDANVLSGNRIWLQLKGTSSVSIHSRQAEVEGRMTTVRYVRFRAETKLLEYALHCGFPLLLGVVDVSAGEAYWLPLRDEIDEYVEASNPTWHKQSTITLEIPAKNSLSNERRCGYDGFRWYALEPARMRAFVILHNYYRDFHRQGTMSGYAFDGDVLDGGEELLLSSASLARSYLKLALDLDVLFGTDGNEVYVKFLKPTIEEGLCACEVLLDGTTIRKSTFDDMCILQYRVHRAIETLSMSISWYREFRQGFLVKGRKSTAITSDAGMMSKQ